MKLFDQIKSRPLKEVAMVVVIITLIIMILTQWPRITSHVQQAFLQRFSPQSEATE
ncbi:MAG: hypothetical protein RR330_05920 [Alistipes sp.]